VAAFDSPIRSQEYGYSSTLDVAKQIINFNDIPGLRSMDRRRTVQMVEEDRQS